MYTQIQKTERESERESERERKRERERERVRESERKGDRCFMRVTIPHPPTHLRLRIGNH